MLVAVTIVILPILAHKRVFELVSYIYICIYKLMRVYYVHGDACGCVCARVSKRF